MTQREIVVTQRAERALHGQVANSINYAGQQCSLLLAVIVFLKCVYLEENIEICILYFFQ
jgi:hypothetical protein